MQSACAYIENMLVPFSFCFAKQRFLQQLLVHIARIQYTHLQRVSITASNHSSLYCVIASLFRIFCMFDIFVRSKAKAPMSSNT